MFSCVLAESQGELVTTLQKDKQLVMAELGRMKVKYADVQGQIDQMTKLMDEKQVTMERDLRLDQHSAWDLML